MVRVIVVGDAQTGKSSIINSFISNTFEDHVAGVIPVAVLPPEASPEAVPLTLVDTPPPSGEVTNIEEEIGKADVAVVVYAADKAESLQSVSSFWLPLLKSRKKNIPVVVVGNKIDLRTGDSQGIGSDIRSAAAPIMEVFKEVESCIECSAKRMINISEVMIFASKAVLHPTAPIYDTQTHELKPACVRALRRIFDLCDEDHDQVLNDIELNKFQTACFGSPLFPRQLRGIKDVIRRNNQDGLTETGVTLSGFLFLHMLFIQRARSETTWAVLRAYGYGKDLRLSPERLPTLGTVLPDQSCELSEQGIAFLGKLFHKFDSDKDEALNSQELSAFFDRAPETLWENRKRISSTDHNGNLDREGFIAQWVAACYYEPSRCMEHLVYLGYGGGRESSVETAIRVTPRRSLDYNRRHTSRNVFQILLCGSNGVDIAACARGLLPEGTQLKHLELDGDEVVAARVPNPKALARGAGIHLLVRGVSCKRAEQIIAENSGTDGKKGSRYVDFDVLVLLYDAADRNSFVSCAGVREQLERTKQVVPFIFCGVQLEGSTVAQQYEGSTRIDPVDYCTKSRLLPPILVELGSSRTAYDQLYHTMAHLCFHPEEGNPLLAAQQKQTANVNKMVMYGVWGALALGGMAIALRRSVALRGLLH